MSFIKTAENWTQGAGDTLNSVSNNLSGKQGNSALMKAAAQGYGGISKNNYNYLIGDEYKFTGTVNAGGISYSGADIKVVLMIYPQGAQALQQLQANIDDQRKALDDTMKQANIAAVGASNLAQGYKQNTIESLNAQKAARENYEISRNAGITRRNLDQQERDAYAKVYSKDPTKVLAEAQTLSISVFRDKQAVRAMGSVYPKGFTRGPRQIGGSLVFTVFDRDVLYEFLEAHPSDFDGNRQTSAIIDQLPPVDIIITFASELGSVSRMALYGVEFVSNGQVMSIEDLITENTVEYVARDMDPMTNVGVMDLKKSTSDTKVWATKNASELLYEQDYQNTKTANDPFARFIRRNTSFL